MVPDVMTDAEYALRMADIGARIRVATGLGVPPIEAAYTLLHDLAGLWGRSNEIERRDLLGAAVEQV